MSFCTLFAISPLDGRYQQKLSELRKIFSEYGLIYHRVIVEIEWLKIMAETPEISELSFSTEQKQQLEEITLSFNLDDANRVKTFENTTNHDMKAVEYFLREKLRSAEFISFIHFGCTSEDINNLAYSLMLKKTREQIFIPQMQQLIAQYRLMGQKYVNLPMLSRTHGQPASTTTLGKEFINIAQRLQRQLSLWQNLPITAKFNGAVGNFNAHRIAYPELDWPKLSKKFIEHLGLENNPYTTQIEPHDNLAEHLHNVMRFNTILIDANRDLWGYIALGYFNQQLQENEVGSSTMPHKINPIDFENSEGNLGLANAIASFLAEKLPISRWQRDLSDSTVMRNLGTVFGYSSLAYQAHLKGLQKLIANEKMIHDDLSQRWEIITEAIQTVMRRYGISDAYEQMKQFSRGKTITSQQLQDFINQLNIPENAKKHLSALTPEAYIGYAKDLAETAIDKIY